MPGYFSQQDSQLLQQAIDDMWNNDHNCLECHLYTGNESDQAKQNHLIVHPAPKNQFFAYHDYIRPRVQQIAKYPLQELQGKFRERGDDSGIYDEEETQQQFQQLLTQFMDAEPFQRMMRHIKGMSIAEHLPQDNDIYQILYSAWFTKFNRRTAESFSSGFEHVFCGEFKKGNGGQGGVNGLHNWVRYFHLDANYGQQGQEFVEFVKICREKDGECELNDDPTPYIATFEFRLYDAQGDQPWEKPTGGFFLGTSPEFDFAVYCMCYLIDWACHKNQNGHTQGNGYSFRVDGWRVGFKMYYMPSGQISSGFPEVGRREEIDN